MKLTYIKKLAELSETLKEAAEKWRADWNMELVSELHVVQVDTSWDSVNGFSAGAITEVHQPKILVEYTISQKEDAEYLIEMPYVPIMRLPPERIDFHIRAIRALLLEYPPEDHDWAEAEAAQDLERADDRPHPG